MFDIKYISCVTLSKFFSLFYLSNRHLSEPIMLVFHTPKRKIDFTNYTLYISCFLPLFLLIHPKLYRAWRLPSTVIDQRVLPIFPSYLVSHGPRNRPKSLLCLIMEHVRTLWVFQYAWWAPQMNRCEVINSQVVCPLWLMWCVICAGNEMTTHRCRAFI